MAWCGVVWPGSGYTDVLPQSTGSGLADLQFPTNCSLFLINHVSNHSSSSSSLSLIIKQEQSFIFTLAFAFFQWQVLEGKLEERGIILISITYPPARCSLLPLGTGEIFASIHDRINLKNESFNSSSRPGTHTFQITRNFVTVYESSIALAAPVSECEYSRQSDMICG